MEIASTSLNLAKYILPEEIFKYFRLCKVVDDVVGELHFYFDELNILPEEYSGEDMESKGFHQESVIKDFPLRDKSLYLHVRRRRWLNKTTGKVVSRDWMLVAEGTHYTQGFAFFFKDLVGYLSDSLQPASDHLSARRRRSAGSSIQGTPE
jgi:hypothetical protein